MSEYADLRARSEGREVIILDGAIGTRLPRRVEGCEAATCRSPRHEESARATDRMRPAPVILRV